MIGKNIAPVNITMTVNTQQQSLPRELHLWIQSLNLTYKINNPKRDLSNGWVFAEIFQRYYPQDIEMYQFDNGFKLDKKEINWVHLTKFFKRKGIEITQKDFEPVIHCAPNSAFVLLKKIYTILTEKELPDEITEIQQQQLKEETENRPDYLRSTITQKMKEKELQRITDQLRLTHTAINLTSDHVAKRKDERYETDFNATKQTGLYAFQKQQQAIKHETKRNMGSTNQVTIDGIPVGEIKSVTVKTANKSIRVMRQEANYKRAANKDNQAVQDEDSDEQSLEQMMAEVIGRTLTHKLNKIDPEFKVFKEHTDRGIGYFTERFQYIPDELVVDIFLGMQGQSDELVEVLTKSMIDLPELLSFFTSSLKQVNPILNSKGSGDTERNGQQFNLLSLMVETLTIIANKLLNTDPQQTELYFLEYGVSDLLEVMVSNTFKLNEMAVLLYCFVQSSNNSHCRVLRKISEKLSANDSGKQFIPALLARLFLFETEDISQDIYTIYFENAVKGLHTPSPIVRTKCVTILAYLSRIRLDPILAIIPHLQKQVHESSWELQGQLLIFASNALTAFDGLRNNLLAEDNVRKVTAETKQGEASKQNTVGTKESDRKERDFETASIPQTITPQTIEISTPQVFSIIDTIFRENCPKATTKIGLIYLAKLINFHPEFTSSYLKVLLACPENIRQAVLEINPLPGTEEEVYVSGANTEKYRTYGAPIEWNNLLIAQELQKSVLNEGLEVLEQNHIDIFDAAIQGGFLNEDLPAWKNLIIQMKNHFLISLCYRDFSHTAIRILKRFFFNEKLQVKVIEECLKIFIKTMVLLYQPDTDQECKENVKEFLEALHDGSDSDSSSELLKGFVYDVIKAFAKENSEAYQQSNLIDLMNYVVDQRRGQIFEEEREPSPTSSMKKSSHMKKTSTRL